MVGSTVVSAQEEDGETADDQLAAVRVAHASPDTPSVDVRLSPSGGAETAGTENETAAPTGDNETVAEGGENETVATDGGNETAAGAEEDGEAEEMTIEGVGFRDVSDYTEIQGGSYQVQIVVTEGGGFLDDLFGGGDDEEVVVLDDELEVEAGTTYTVVAYGEIGQAEDPERVAEFEMADEGAEDDAGLDTAGEDDSPAAAGDGEDENATAVGEEDNATAVGEEAENASAVGEDDDDSAIGEEDNATAVGEDDNATAAGDDEEGALGDGDEMDDEDDTSFQVKVLEDDISDPGEGRTRLRVFHAVPDTHTVSITATSQGDGEGEEGEDEQIAEENGTDLEGDEPGEEGPEEGDGNETAAGEGDDVAGGESDGTAGGGESIDELDFGDFDTLELDAGDYTLEFRETEGQLGDAGTDVGEDGNATAVGEEDNATAAGEDDETLGEEGGDAGAEGNETELGEDENGAVGDEAEDDAESVQTVEISPNEGVAYSGFALGYFNPELATDGTEDGEAGDNVTTDGNVTDVEETGDDETAAGNETAEDGEAGEGEEDIAEDPEGEEFELVTVSDFEDGERADGGTGGDGLF